MKKVTILTALLLISLSCKKEEIEKTEKSNAPVNEEVCGCGIISDIIHEYNGIEWVSKTIIYNECTLNDTTVNYVPQTTTGYNKDIDDPHCLGVNW